MSNRAAPRRPRVVLAEIDKLLSLRSVRVTILLVGMLSILAAASQAGSIGDALRTKDPALAPGITPETVGFEWVALGLIGIIVIGVLAAGSEYPAQLPASLMAVPDRARLYLGKILALSVITGFLGAVTIPVMSLLSQWGIGNLSVLDGSLPASLLLRWVGALLFWMMMALQSFALATIMRQSLLPLFILIVVSQLSLLLLLLGDAMVYLPTIAGVQLFAPGLVTGSYPDAALGIVVAAGVTAGWSVALLGIAGWCFLARDTT